MTVEARQALFERNYALLEAREKALSAEVGGCVGTGARSEICGLSATEAPDPWLALGGQKCRGFDTKSARFGDYCGYWDSDKNPDAAPAEEKEELLRAGPWCYADLSGDKVLECDGRAQRTQRAQRT